MKKYNKMKEKIDAISDFLRKGVDLETLLTKNSEKIRKLSRENYGPHLLEARILMTSILSELLRLRQGIAGITNDSISERIHLITSFIQGIDITETAISEGQYMKAAAIEKQNYEILTRIYEVKKGVHKEGENPQVRNMPEELKRINGDLNKIAHPSNNHVIYNLLRKVKTDSINSVSYLPEFRKATSREMYELHLIIMFKIMVETVTVLVDMYGEEITEDFQDKKLFTYMDLVKINLKKSGAI